MMTILTVLAHIVIVVTVIFIIICAAVSAFDPANRSEMIGFGVVVLIFASGVLVWRYWKNHNTRPKAEVTCPVGTYLIAFTDKDGKPALVCSTKEMEQIDMQLAENDRRIAALRAQIAEEEKELLRMRRPDAAVLAEQPAPEGR